MQIGGGSLPDILYDGVVDPKIAATKKGANPGDVCLTKNGTPTFLNLDAANNFKRPKKDVKAHECSLPPLEAVTIPQLQEGSSKAGGQ